MSPPHLGHIRGSISYIFSGKPCPESFINPGSMTAKADRQP